LNQKVKTSILRQLADPWKKHMPFDQILVPFDGSEGAQHAATTGCQLASQLGLPLKLAYVVPMTAESTMALANLTKEEVQEIHQKQADASSAPRRIRSAR
jgi:nucleotide-binding universal stress UspA family protein